MKVSDILEGGSYPEEWNAEQQAKLDAEMKKYKEMSSNERKTAYKPYGKLGKHTKPEQVLKHKAFGDPKHRWSFDSQYTGYSEEKCRICSRTRYIRANGQPFYR